MNMKNSQRAFRRYKYTVPVKIYNDSERHRQKNMNAESIALLKNYSRGGVYFETQTYIPPGTLVSISFADEPDLLASSTGKQSKAKVVWCKKIGKAGSQVYGIGLKYDSIGNHFFFGF